MLVVVVFFQLISRTLGLVMPARKLMACVSLPPNYTTFDSIIVVGVFRLAEVKTILDTPRERKPE